MKTKSKYSVSILCVLMVVLAVFGLVACGDKDVCLHQWGEWTVTTNATCATEGTQERKCSACGETETSAIPSSDHTWKDATCTEPKICTSCQATEGAATGHTGGTATCSAKAECSACGAQYGEFNADSHVSESVVYASNQDGTHTKKYACCQTVADQAEACSGGTATCQEKAVCSACHATYGDLGTHNYDQTAWGYKAADGHAHVCSTAGCNEHDSVAAHTSSGAATEAVAETCTVCEYIITPATGHITHTPETEWAKNETHHWNECTGCEDQAFNKAEHVYDHSCDTTCNTCGYERAATHAYTVVNHDANNHWRECAVCHVIEPDSTEAHKGGTANCGSKALCDVCNAAYGSLNGTNHTSGQYIYVTNNDGTHTKKHECCGVVAVASEACSGGNATCMAKAICQCCEVAYGELAAHTGENATCGQQAVCTVCGNAFGGLGQHAFSVENPDAAYIASHATCDAAATYYKTCACGAVGTETFVSGSALGHDYGDWTSKDGRHTKICKNDFSHVVTDACSGGAATCEKAAICATCGHEYASALGHAYGAWEETVAPACTTIGTKTATCTHDGCNDSKTEDIPATGHTYTDLVTAPTCTAQGYTLHTCACGNAVVDTYVDPVEHNWDIPAPTCTQGQGCRDCDATTEALGHDYETSSTEATCTVAATITYTCKRNCGHDYTDTVGTAIEHDVKGVTPVLVAVEGQACRFVQHYECQACHGDVTGETVWHHDQYIATIVTPATCTTEGTKKLTCSTCEYVKPELEVIPIDDVTGHNWNSGVESQGVTTYTCLHNSEHTKTAVTVGTGDTVNAQDIKNTELQLSGGANVTLGDAGDFIGNDHVTVSVNTVDKTTVNLSEEQLAQVGNSEIYDFSIENSAGPIDFEGNTGLITVTLPYTLKDGDNVDNIAVWYIDDNGELTSYKATYNEVDGKGYVTFKTDHFSYYTVTELTPKERCKLYGHSETTKYIAPTCTEDGYTLSYCVRCGHSSKIIDEGTKLGHSYEVDEQNSVSATCTAVGKTVYACSVCEHTYQVRVAAIGHDWSESGRVDATCIEAGSISYMCQNDCGKTYNELIAKLPHNMKEEVIAPTCTTIGYTLHTCANDGCDYAYDDQIIQPVGHFYEYEFVWNDDYTEVNFVVTCGHDGCDHTESIVIDEILLKNIPASCDKNGMDEYTVVITHNGKIQVDKKQKDRDDQKQGHAYGNSFIYDEINHWHVCSKCGEDKSTAEAHEFKKGIVIKTPTCTETGREAFACKSCGYVKLVELPATGEHTYVAADIKSDANCHWNECSVCGTKCHVADHSFVVNVLVEATCSEPGETASECSVCHYTEVQTIPATGVHTYEDGVCTSCGIPEGTCTHQTLHESVFDLSEYGMCVSELDMLSCECGEVVRLQDYEQLVESCDWEQSDDYIEGVDENGNLYMSSTMICSVCHAELYVYATLDASDPCHRVVTYIFTVTMGETVVLDEIVGIESYVNHDDTESEKIDLSEYSSCGGYYYVDRCTVCGEIDYVYNVNFNCDIDESMGEREEVIDENGHVHSVITVTCPDCGLVYVVDTYTDVISVCEFATYFAMTVYYGDEVIYHDEDEDWTNEHAYETQYELLGDTCEDGYTVIRHCDKCDTTQTYTSSGHNTIWTEIDLADYGACGGYAYGGVCQICGLMVRVSGFNPSCASDGEATTETYVDDNGISHTVRSMTCAACGLTIVQDSWIEETACLSTVYANLTVTINGNTIISAHDSEVQENRHQYVETIEPRGDDCEEDGYVVTRTCSVCGDTERYGTYGHYEELVTIDLSEHGACGGMLECYQCKICGKILEIDDIELDCDIDMSTEPPVQEIVDENGITHYVQAIACPTCGLTITTEMWEVVDGCTSTEYMIAVISIGEATLIRLEDNYTSTNHEYEYFYEMLGDSCEDGWHESRVCKKCGESYSYGSTGSGHNTTYQYIDLSQYSSCGGYAQGYICRICGRIDIYNSNINFNCNTDGIQDAPVTEVADENGNVHYIQSIACSDCGLIFTQEIWEECESVCESRNYTKITVSTADGTILDWYMYDEDIGHEYETTVTMNGATCDEGYTITHLCALCGETRSNNYYGCQYEYIEYDLAELGVPCGGYVELYQCIGCGNVNHAYNNYGCYFEQTDMSEDGYAIYTCPDCGTVRYNRTVTGDRDSNCSYVVTREYILYVDGEVVFEYSYNRTYAEHDYKQTFTMDGESCTDGLTITHTCVNCGDIQRESVSYHYQTEVYNINSSDNDFCDHHEFHVTACPCGEESSVYHDFYDGDNIDYTCEDCSFRLTITNSVERDGCYQFQTRITTLCTGETELYQDRYMFEYAYHNMVVSAERFDDGHIVITAICADCDLTTSYTMGNSETVELVYDASSGEYYYDLMFAPESSGYYTIYSMNYEDTYVTLFRIENDEYIRIDSDDDGDYNSNNFRLESYLESGYTYVYRMRFYSTGTSGSITYVLAESATVGGGDDGSCNHDTNRHYVLPTGVTSCEDGLLNVCVCYYCGMITSVRTTTEHLGNETHYDLSDYGACYGEIYVSACACGEYGYTDYSVGCYSNRENDYIVDENGLEHSIRRYTCEVCGKVVVVDSYTVQEGCAQITYIKIDVSINEEAVLSVNSVSRIAYDHDYAYSFAFENAEGEHNCEDGVTVIYTCIECGDSYRDYFADHRIYLQEIIDLSEYGTCGGELEVYACPCGALADLNYWTACYTSYTEEAYVDANGNKHILHTYACSDCGLLYTVDNHIERANCQKVSYSTYNFAVGDTVILEDHVCIYRTTEHAYEYIFQFDDAEGEPNCENGVTVIRICVDCGYSYTETTYWHETIVKEHYDLSEYGACGGYLSYYECACGKNNGINRNFHCNYVSTNETYIDEEGRLHNVYARTCDTCGLRYQSDSYTVSDAGTCTETTYYQISLNVGATLVATINYETSTESHQYIATGSLNEGSASCEDGVTITYTCYCGESYTDHYSSHILLESERYDLAAEEYGSAYHMGYVLVKTCACGAKSDIVLDSMCEFDSRSINCWIDGVVNGYVHTAASPWGSYYGYNAYVLTCAVTDPQCGYRIRYATYYLPIAGECMAEQWKTWQLGYNAEDGTYLYEISVKTGNVITYHPYVYSSMDESYDNGMWKVSGARYDCPDCGSYYYDALCFNENGIIVSRDLFFENKLDDGHSKGYHEHFEFDEKGNILLERYTYTDADGTIVWDQHEYVRNNRYTYTLNGIECNGYESKNIYTNSNGETSSGEYAYVYYKGYQYDIYRFERETSGHWHRWDYSYNLNGTCERTILYTNSNGEERTTTEGYHITYWETNVAPTCTQDGYRSQHCYVCESILLENVVVNPTAHDWYYVSENFYVCTICGLENVNGASGDIVFEDLTNRYGNGENYVAGYWAQNDVQFVYNVSLILHTPLADGNDQIILDGIHVFELENVRALAFGKADVLAMVEAKAAELGMVLTPDMYDVRFSFVPLGADERHDYSITFTEEEMLAVSGSETVTFDMYSYENVNIIITPETSGTWIMYSTTAFDSYGTLYDANGRELAYNDDGYGSGDFYIAYELTAGETYTLMVKAYSYGSYMGIQPVDVTFVALAEDEA